MTAQIANHLWQSTLFLAIAALLTLAFRKNRAQVRYWLWLAASVKCLVPFAALVALGNQCSWRPAAPLADSPMTVLIDVVSRPFSESAIEVAAPASQIPASSDVVAALPVIVFAIWFAGFAATFLTWWVRWRRVAAMVRDASPLLAGREWEILRRLEASTVVAGLQTRPLPLVSSDSSLEPGVFGIRRPVLLWPRSISDRLSDEQIEAIFAHEFAHLRRHDNLAAALHMVVQGLFWYYPLVWWVGARLVDERERACDEDVIRHGSDPQVYAESILKTCEFCVESPLVCVSGVTGSDLKKRIEQIMSSDAGFALNVWRKLALAAIGLAAIAGPVMVGVLHAPRLRAQSPAAVGPGPAFEVASVKPNKSGDGPMMMQIQPGGRMTVTNTPLRLLIRRAYRLQDFQIVGAPDWLNSDRFDIIAKADGNPTQDKFVPMLQALLAERFKLAVHNETRELPVYALVLARSDRALGPKLQKAEFDCAALRNGPPVDPAKAPLCGFRASLGVMTAKGVDMAALASTLSSSVGRVVVDRTGLSGEFDLDLAWTPDRLPQQPLPPELPPIDPNGPALFTALQEQLGLKLESTKGPVDVLVIDRAEKPTADDDFVVPPPPPRPPR